MSVVRISSDDNVLQQSIKRRRISRVTSQTNEEGESSQVVRRPISSKKQCGSIKKIVLKNVFCHENLQFDGFTSRINLLQGANGSGKSSIVAAIVAGLGGSSKDTDRGQNITSLIQHGKQWASIEIHLNNDGCNSYREDTYGKSIIVERKLLASGSSSYKVKSERGNIISTKKEELTKILDRFNFQVDNPILILSQERAKTFLGSTDPKTLCKFFLTSTQLKQWCESIQDVRNDITNSEELVVRKRENLSYLKNELEKIEEKMKLINSLEEKREMVSTLVRAKAWAEVDEIEKEVRSFMEDQRKMEEQLKKIAKILDKVKFHKDQLATLDRESNDDMIALSEKSKDLESRRPALKAEWEQASARSRGKLHQKKELEKERLEKERDVQVLRDKLEQDNNEAKAHWDDIINKLNIEKERLQTDITEVREKISTETGQMNNLNMTIQETDSEYHHLSAQEIALKDRSKRLQRELQELKQQTDNITVFGQFMPRLLKEIEIAHSRRRFQNKPIGPLGSYLKVQDNRWIHVVERVTYNLLSSFLVCNAKDMNILSEIFNRVIPKDARRPQIIVSAFRDRVHNVQRFETQTREYFSLWSILEIENIHVANTLLDQLNIESMLLIPTAVEAMDLLQDEATVPRNCKKAMTLHGDTIIPAPDYRIYSGNGNTTVKFLQVSVEDKVKDLESNIRSTDDEVRTSVMEISENRKENSMLLEQKRESARKLEGLRNALNEYQKKWQDTRNREVPPPPDVKELQNDLKENETRKGEIEAKLLDIIEQLENNKKEESEAKQRFEEVRRESEKIKMEATNYQSNAHKIREDLLKNKKELIAYTNKEKEIKEKHTVNQKSMEDQQNVINKKINELTQDEETKERVTLNKSKKQIEKELNALRAVIQEKEADYGDVASIAESLRAKSHKYENVRKELKSQQHFIETMKSGMTDRLFLINQAKKLYKMILNTSFASTIKKRNLRGEICLDYKTETLRILMTKDIEKNSELQSLQMLSGGERSFATVSFILALWEIVASPIRIMDEFDIFMDVVSRKQCMDMIVDAVKEGCQYIMVSPLEYRVISDKVNVFRMEAPKRKQSKEDD